MIPPVATKRLNEDWNIVILSRKPTRGSVSVFASGRPGPLPSSSIAGS
jgi:hypothetical protein